jgi:tRNA dimethylallyltransferase
MTHALAARPDAVILAGPTCTGKTALALQLAEHFPVEIISVDSAQVYRGMDIGTSKPARAVLDAVPHHLIDLCDPAEAYSAGRFRRDATASIAAIHARGRVPLLVGGTMLYFRALTRGIAMLPEANPALRERIDRRARQLGWAALHTELACSDPAAAARIRPADGQRIQRALEVLELTGQPLSRLQQQLEPPPFVFAAFALLPKDRPELYARIDARFLQMMQQGFLDEVRLLRARSDLNADLPSLRSVGYRQLWAHLAGDLGLDDAIAGAQRATRNLAKRQLTWIRSEPAFAGLHGLEDQELAPIKGAIAAVLDRG